jgi:hypothetical protein
MTLADYWAAQEAARARLGIGASASQLLDQWNALIDACVEGYSWDVSEYNNEMFARDQLARILDDEELRGFAAHKDLAERVGQADTRFRILLLPDLVLPGQSSWSRAGVLRRAGPDYARYFRDAYGVDIEVV